MNLYQGELDSAHQKLPARREFLQTLKRKKPKNLDDQFHDLHHKVFEEVDCLKCANCCKTTSPLFQMTDIERLAKSLKIKPQQFIHQYLKIDEDGDYVLQSSPCPFLDADNYCLVYKDRPTACREYPHTNRKRMYQILDITEKNTLICPAVARIVDELSKVG